MGSDTGGRESYQWESWRITGRSGRQAPRLSPTLSLEVEGSRGRREGACLLSVLCAHHLIIRAEAASRQFKEASVIHKPRTSPPVLPLFTERGKKKAKLILVMCSFCDDSQMLFAQACLKLVLLLCTNQFLPIAPLSDTPECVVCCHSPSGDLCLLQGLGLEAGFQPLFLKGPFCHSFVPKSCPF